MECFAAALVCIALAGAGIYVDLNYPKHDDLLVFLFLGTCIAFFKAVD